MVPSPTFYQSTFKQYKANLPEELETVQAAIADTERQTAFMMRWLQDNEPTSAYDQIHAQYQATLGQLDAAYEFLEEVWSIMLVYVSLLCIVTDV